MGAPPHAFRSAAMFGELVAIRSGTYCKGGHGPISVIRLQSSGSGLKPHLTSVPRERQPDKNSVPSRSHGVSPPGVGLAAQTEINNVKDAAIASWADRTNAPAPAPRKSQIL